MWRFRRRYNSLVCFIVAVIILMGTTILFSKDDSVYGSEENESVIRLAEEESKAVTTSLEIQNFAKPINCIRYALGNLDSCAGYKSTQSGTVSASGKLVGISYEFCNNIGSYKEVNNKTNEAYCILATTKRKTIGANKAIKYYVTGDTVSEKNGSWTGNGFSYGNQTTDSEKSDYIQKWGISPLDLFIKIDQSKISKPTWNSIDGNYHVYFTVPAIDACRDIISFCLKIFNESDNLSPNSANMNIEMVVNKYGVLKSIECDITFNCDIPSTMIPISVGSNAINVDGTISIKETFASIDSNINVTKFTK